MAKINRILMKSNAERKLVFTRKRNTHELKGHLSFSSFFLFLGTIYAKLSSSKGEKSEQMECLDIDNVYP